MAVFFAADCSMASIFVFSRQKGYKRNQQHRSRCGRFTATRRDEENLKKDYPLKGACPDLSRIFGRFAELSRKEHEAVRNVLRGRQKKTGKSSGVPIEKQVLLQLFRG
jgi:hypothetical protein